MSKRGAYLDSLRETFDCAFRVLTSERFKKMEGLNNEVPFFVLRYKPEWEPTVDDELSRLRRRLREERYRLADIDVFTLAAGFWMSSPAFGRMLSTEATLPARAHAPAPQLPAAFAGAGAAGRDLPGIVSPVAVDSFGAGALRSGFPGQLLSSF